MTQEQPLLGGRYQLAEVLGRGGMAEVRRAYDERLGRTVAIKQLRTELAGDSTFQARFRREAQAAAGLNHPNIVSVYDIGISHKDDLEIPYIVMEYVDGPTLRDVLREEHKIMPDRAFEMTQGVLDALQYSHKAGIIHRDIKPANVMLTKSGQVKVMDFGIARAVSDTAASMTQTAAVIGTAQYLSPEQARGETVDARSDVYSAGCLLYELLTGRPPFIGESPVSVAYQHVRETPTAPSQISDDNPEITPDMDRIVLKALAKSPDERYSSALAMREDLARLRAGESVTAVIPAAFESTPTQVLPPVETTAIESVQEATAVTSTMPQRALPPEPKKRKSALAPIIATLAVLLVISLLGWVGYSVYQKQHPQQPTLVSVPAVKGYPAEAAKSHLTDATLAPIVKEVSGPADTTVNQVIDQDPAAGQKVNPGTKVTISVNVGPERVEVPRLAGLNKDEAQRLLKASGFGVALQISNDEPATAKAGDVLSTNPGEGTKAPKGSTITVTYARGMATIPGLRNHTLDEALAMLAKEGITGTITTDGTDGNCQVKADSQSVGKICSQDP
ncbi:MAG: Stk1 family PASTA domain-containing Ser/Thr kinase, partial [Propionibacteriaceae bacterium]